MTVVYTGPDMAGEQARRKGNIVVTCALCGSVKTKRYDKRYEQIYCSNRCSLISRNRVTQPDPERFWQKVAIAAERECWLWRGRIGRGGYGQYSFKRRTVAAHRHAYLLHHGVDSLPAGMMVCHSCDIPACCNPSHLWLGTGADNMKDMWRKRRKVALSGERHPMARLSVADVVAIRQSCFPANQIAGQFSISTSLVYMIRNRRAWKDVPA